MSLPLSLLYARQPNFNLLICSEIKSTPSHIALHTHRERDTDIICSVLGHSTRSRFDSIRYFFAACCRSILFHLRDSIWIFYQRSEFISQIGFDYYAHVRVSNHGSLSVDLCIPNMFTVTAFRFGVSIFLPVPSAVASSSSTV